MMRYLVSIIEKTLFHDAKIIFSLWHDARMNDELAMSALTQNVFCCSVKNQNV